MAVIKIPSLECEPGAENEFGTTDTYQIQSYAVGDWDGILGSTVKFYSNTPGAQATIDLSVCGNIGSTVAPLEYVDFTDIKFTGASVYARAKTCSGQISGNNSGIIWVGSAAKFFFFFNEGDK
jgi:hypothetical protein